MSAGIYGHPVQRYLYDACGPNTGLIYSSSRNKSCRYSR